jgi:hypothetical protein
VPALSVVIGSINPGRTILECLDALAADPDPDREIIVVDASRDGTPAAVRARYPEVRVIEAPASANLPRLRGIGMAEARAPLIGILDPSCRVASGWTAATVRAHRERPEPAIGGPVELPPAARRSLGAWSTYLFEYWEFVPPMAEGPAPVLSGNNVTYKRAALANAETLRAVGFWKAFVHVEFARVGQAVWMAPELTVVLRKRIPVTGFLLSRFHHGRSYAAMRVERDGVGTRVARAAGTPLLPLVFFGRQVRGLVRKPIPFAWLLATAPLMLAYHVSWALGELWGYLGGPGRSHDALRY